MKNLEPVSGVYVVFDPNTHLCKIGSTSNIAERIKRLNSIYKTNLALVEFERDSACSLVDWIPSPAQMMETYHHRLYKPFRMKHPAKPSCREWYGFYSPNPIHRLLSGYDNADLINGCVDIGYDEQWSLE